MKPEFTTGDRTVLHVDMNNFFASVECRDRPELQGLPVAVAGDIEARHGIILAKNTVAKGYGVRTGESISEARRKCPRLILLAPHIEKYIEISRAAREIYCSYTDKVESFGIDECWLDVGNSRMLFGGGREIAECIRQRVKNELGVTVSVGISFNKVFAKMGSDYKKPDAVTEITRENFRERLWPLPAGELLFVGRATTKKLFYANIRTIGELACADRQLLSGMLGKNGLLLRDFANGLDSSPVISSEMTYAVKSIGNSTTAPRDLVCERDVEITLAVLCESVAARLRAEEKKCTVVKLSVRNTRLEWYERQCRVSPTYLESELFKTAYSLFRLNHPHDPCGGGIEPIRSIGVCGASLVPEVDEQLTILDGAAFERARREALEHTIDRLRGRYGSSIVRRALMLEDTRLSGFCPRDEHVIHPERFGR